MDQAGDIPLVLQPQLQHPQAAGQLPVGLGDGLQRHLSAVVLEILHHQHGVIPLFLRLDLVPVGKAIQALLLIVDGEIQVQIGRIKLLVDLLVEQLRDLCVQYKKQLLFLFSETLSESRSSPSVPRSGAGQTDGSGPRSLHDLPLS